MTEKSTTEQLHEQFIQTMHLLMRSHHRRHHHGGIPAGRGQAGRSQGHILLILSESPTLGQRELLERLDIRPSSLSELLNKLEKAGFVSRTQDTEDKRATNVSLTDAGKEFIAQHEQDHAAVAESLFAALSGDEQETLLALLQKLSADWRKDDADGQFPEEGCRPHRGGRGRCGKERVGDAGKQRDISDSPHSNGHGRRHRGGGTHGTHGA